MKTALVCTGILVGLLVFLAVLQTFAAERVEVVELETLDSSGRPVITRLWVVDHEGSAWLRVGARGSGWFDRLQAGNTIRVTRNGRTETFTTVLRPDKSEVINRLMQEKYTWGDTFFATILGGRRDSVPIELHPVLSDRAD